MRTTFYLLSLLTIGLLTSCSSSKLPSFANYTWKIDPNNGNIADAYNLYCFSFGDALVDTEIPIICNQDSVNKYPGMEKYLKNICTHIGVEVNRILFYAPEKKVLFVEYEELNPPLAPRSITINIDEEERLL